MINMTDSNLLRLNLATKYDNPELYSKYMPENCEVLVSSGETDDWVGYFGRAYKCNNNEIVIASRGSTDKDDELQYPDFYSRGINLLLDIGMGCFWGVYRFQVPIQIESADDFYQGINTTYGADYKISFTGFSLGGLLATMLGYKYNVSTIAFDPPGDVEILREYGIEPYKDIDLQIILAEPNIVNTHGIHSVEPYYIDIDYHPSDISLISFVADVGEIHNLEKMYSGLTNSIKKLSKEWPRNIEEAYNHFLDEHSPRIINHKWKYILSNITDEFGDLLTNESHESNVIIDFCDKIKNIKSKIKVVKAEIKDSEIYGKAVEYCDDIVEFIDRIMPIDNAYSHFFKEIWGSISDKFESIFSEANRMISGDTKSLSRDSMSFISVDTNE
jgi:hypothetical protein